MKSIRLLFTLFVLAAASGLQAQPLEQRVTLRYTSEPLGAVLQDISQAYKVRFSYSPDFIPVERRVSLNVVDEPLYTALEDISSQVPLKFAAAGGQVLLRGDKRPETRQLGQLETRPPKVKQTSPIYPSEPKVGQGMAAERERLKRFLSPISQSEGQKVIKNGGGDGYKKVNFDIYRLPPPEVAIAEKAEQGQTAGDTRLAQISLLPFVGTNALRSNEITNRVSVNLLWGTNGGVDGVEVGGIVNNVKNDVRGVQVAGLGSRVGGKVTGTQVGGLFNINRDSTVGVQAAGLINVAGDAKAVQAAGLVNVTNGDMAGVQAAGLFNISAGKADGLQIASLFNSSGGLTRTQIASVFNIAGDVRGGQASALLNVGKRVDGFQIGLINVADTVSGVPIGLLNIVKHGYNRFELAANDALYANASLKLGAYSFYNIIQAGARWDQLNGSTAASDGTYMSWALGYGLGSAIVFNPRLLLNIEAVALHVNEMESWTDELNLLNQLRLSLDFHKPDGRSSFFAGPVGHLMVSNVQDPDSGEIGSAVIVPSYTLLDQTKGGTNVKLWVGLQAGVRF